MAGKSPIRVEIYDQSYPFGGEQDAAYLQRLAAVMDAKMRQVARETRVVDSMRIAVLAAMNLADENETLRARVERLEQGVVERSQRLHRTLDQALGKAR